MNAACVVVFSAGQHLGNVFQGWQASGQDVILQPPKPEIIPSTRILQLAAEQDIQPEAAD